MANRGFNSEAAGTSVVFLSAAICAGSRPVSAGDKASLTARSQTRCSLEFDWVDEPKVERLTKQERVLTLLSQQDGAASTR